MSMPAADDDAIDYTRPEDHLSGVRAIRQLVAELELAEENGDASPRDLDDLDCLYEALEVVERRSARRHFVRVPEPAIRRWARAQGPEGFARRDLEAAYGMSSPAAANRIGKLIEAGIVELTDPTLPTTSKHRRYRYVPPPAKGAPKCHPVGEVLDLGHVAAVIRGEAIPSGKRPKAGRREVEELLTAAEAAGAIVSKRSTGHFRVWTPQGSAMVPGTPSDHRSLPNARAAIRRLGLDV